LSLKDLCQIYQNYHNFWRLTSTPGCLVCDNKKYCL